VGLRLIWTRLIWTFHHKHIKPWRSDVRPAVPVMLTVDIFFKTTDCLRFDKSTCFPPGDKNYQITHSGLDAQVCSKKIAKNVSHALIVLVLLLCRHATCHAVCCESGLNLA
jgi:hypothetical protein